MKSLNVWIVTSEFPPMYGGGISTYCREAGMAWAESGHSVTVFTRANPGQTEISEESLQERFGLVRVPVVAAPKLQAALGYWHLMSYCIADEIIRRIKTSGITPDMIEVQDYGAMAYFLLKRKLAGAPELTSTRIVIYSHTPVFELAQVNQEPSYLFPNYWLGQCEKFCLRAADAVLSPSEFLKGKIQQHTDKPIEVIPYPHFQTASEPSGKGEDVPEFDCIYLGRLEYRKGVVQLLSAFKTLWEAGHKIRLRMVGGDTHWSPKQISMKTYIQNRYSSFIDQGLLTLSEPVPTDQLPAIFASARVVVVPSIYENYPYVCMQAMELGMPVVVSKSGGQAEMVGSDSSCGWVFDWDQPNSFQDTIQQALASSPAELKTIGSNGQLRIRDVCSVPNFIQNRTQHLARTIALSDSQPAKYPFAHEDVKVDRIAPVAQDVSGSVSGRISVVIPFYNLAAFLPDTLASVAASDYADIEIVIVNDGSTDSDAIKLLGQLRQTSPHLRILDIENGGLANARNVGARAATGEYVAFLDADDCVMPTYYSQCAHILKKFDNVSFVYSWLNYFGESEGYWLNFDTEFPYFLAANMLAAFQVVRKKDFLEAGINDQEMMFGMEDFEAWLRMASLGYKGVSIPEPLVNYRVRHNSMARQFRRSTVLYMYEQMAKKNPAIYQRFGDELFMLMNANGPGYLWNNPTMTYPSIGYIGDGAITAAESTAVATEFSAGDLMRLKALASRPFMAKIIRLVLSFKADKWFKR
ncbi:glycosyltransferase [Achromobacter animicus]|uniref:glycosyltransferase n=1 Tax=Achromobacter animicus TaxID=1389935 RepID=UPI00345E8E5A